ncbi:hypothetical protein PsorP6_001648 [Peronosclerospora sorghi]|uniref:Uncharacterized protein n=1 Tax=Peronosclerospora sorghi TaxID=230839 RepID=A0ACC0WU88_9STRA|nr:hypothetical protein PsorP6_001648 [Peronosclerospora sorghi]
MVLLKGPYAKGAKLAHLSHFDDALLCDYCLKAIAACGCKVMRILELPWKQNTELWNCTRKSKQPMLKHHA